MRTRQASPNIPCEAILFSLAWWPHSRVCRLPRGLSLKIPKFETLFYGEFELEAINSLNSTFGSRVNIALTGGNLTDTSGNLAATLLPTSDTGVISNSGIFFPQATMFWRWAADDKFAYLRLDGVGIPYESDVVYVHMETDSTEHIALNSRFLLANVTFVAGEGSNPLFTLFGLV
ncbi:hypothetical protein L227DRAFT_650925 [Lentinus tigrinus ALCF2SS1-6]|uniref:Uncharacterized protein n=1 Tax=Lentinus tigrinus ALCF2SS1-6 TaxID=1328759 RepID=A0A5C2SL00_9APHY|nr:hypothetical protein L227DRAFT_650925 [Lentinus tigrinus ALCF2SS1-6]